MILIADANVLIDLGHLPNGLSTLVGITPVEVLDVVLLECEHTLQSNLVKDIRKAGIKEIESAPEWLDNAPKDSKGRLSSRDKLTLYYAQAFGRVLLTGDSGLRNLSQELKVEVHGTLWVVEQAQLLGLQKEETLCTWLKSLSELNRWLPRADIERIRLSLKCKADPQE